MKHLITGEEIKQEFTNFEDFKQYHENRVASYGGKTYWDYKAIFGFILVAGVIIGICTILIKW